jgi:hypothetical protein
MVTKDGKIKEIKGAAIISKDITRIKIFEVVTMQSVFFVVRILRMITQYGSISMKKRLGMQKLR